jgi:hypothetical protein
MRTRWTMFLACALLASPASAARDGRADAVRELAVRAGPIVGGALACREIVRSRPHIIVNRFDAVICDAAANEAGGVDGRMLKLIGDDGYSPARALAAMKQLFETDRLFGYVGNGDSKLNFEHRASHKVWATSFDEAGIFQLIDLE